MVRLVTGLARSAISARGRPLAMSQVWIIPFWWPEIRLVPS